MLIGFCRTSASRLTGVAGRGARASVLTAGVAGTGVCGTNAQNDCGKACENDLICNHYASPWFHPSKSSVFGATLRIYENNGTTRRFR
jgi:hypothetical protein